MMKSRQVCNFQTTTYLNPIPSYNGEIPKYSILNISSDLSYYIFSPSIVYSQEEDVVGCLLLLA
uniref:Uncharacterized protein n=1 Tax=Arion vulgaris TaxID=1028688 RepID=A0A0B7AU77_9EUPU